MDDRHVSKIVKDFIARQSDIKIDRYSQEGGNADLYFGKHKVFQDRVALKFYYVDALEEAHDEPKILRKIEHENILKIYDARLIDKKYAYFLTPEIKGGDLQEKIDSEIISSHDGIRIVKDILKGLSELHRKPHCLVHRDLKPNNVLVTKEGRAVIADLGAARRIGKEEKYVRASKGSRFYRPKESVLSNQYSFQSDIYQVGVILFQILGGHFPSAYADWFSSKELARLNKIKNERKRIEAEDILIEEKIVRGKFLKLESLPDYVDKKLKSIIKKATHIDMKKRYSSISEFLHDLYKYEHSSKSWTEEVNGHLYATKDENEYRVIPSKKGFYAERRSPNGSWRKLDKKPLSRIEAIKKINEKK